MESKKIELYQITPEQLTDSLVLKVESILTNSLKKINLTEEKEELLSVQETITFLKCSKQALWNWRKSGILSSYRLGNRVYYKKSDIFKKLIKQD